MTVSEPDPPSPVPIGAGVCLITGASAGLGAEFARQLAQRGRSLVLIARNRERLAELADRLRGSASVSCEVLAADLSTDDGVARVRARVAAGDVDLLVNNAGFGTIGSMIRVAPTSQDEMLRLHVLAPNAITHEVLPHMVRRGGGAIINVSSVASFVTSAGNVNYCASKAYLRVFSEALAQEVGKHGIRVQALCPGFTHTEFHERGAMDMRHVPQALWLNAERVVRESLGAIERGGPVVVIPSKRYRAIVFLLRHAPLWMRTRGAKRYRRDTR
ncbi:MAG: SDR family oxidoreductase [Gemmatimonadaceae bacterium]